MCVRACVCTRMYVCAPVGEREISQPRGMLSLPAGALRRAWAAVWFSVCIRGGGV